MKKILAICLPLLLVTGCGETEQANESPTLADSFQGKRIHFQVEKPESDHTLEFWLQFGNTKQLTAGSGQLTMGEGDEGLITAFDRKSDTIFISLLPSVIELRFAKAELAVGDPVTVVEHFWEGTDDFQARVDSAADSTAFATVKGSIVKIEAAQEIEAITFEAWSQQTNPDPSESIPSSKSASAKIQLQAIGKALDLYQIDMNSYPASAIGLRALMERPTDLDPSMIWGGPYLKRDVPPDPWGNAYLYEVGLNDFELQVYKIWSAGPNQKNENGKDGTDDIVVYSDR